MCIITNIRPRGVGADMAAPHCYKEYVMGKTYFQPQVKYKL